MPVVLTADVHAHTFSTFSYITSDGYNSRLRSTLGVVRDIMEACLRKSAPFIHVGDWFHSRRSIPVEALHLTLSLFQDYPTVPKYFIVGNHDLLLNKGGSPYSVKAFEKYGEVIYKPTTFSIPPFTFYALPWLSNKESMLKGLSGLAKAARGSMVDGCRYRVLLAHVGLQGAVVGPDDYVMSGDLPVKSLKHKCYDLCLLGHFHKRQQLRDRIHYLGSPCPVTMGERCDDKSYAILNDDGSLSFTKTRHPRMFKVACSTMVQLTRWFVREKPPRGSAILLVTDSIALSDITHLEKDYCIKLTRPKQDTGEVSLASISTGVSYNRMLDDYLDLVDVEPDLDKELLRNLGHKCLSGADNA